MEKYENDQNFPLCKRLPENSLVAEVLVSIAGTYLHCESRCLEAEQDVNRIPAASQDASLYEGLANLTTKDPM
jgi:hypothetical protein